MKRLADHMEMAGWSADDLARAAGFDATLVGAIARGNYTPSPLQRQRLAGALGVPADEVDWGHAVPVQHLRGNGPQSGRDT